MKILIDIDGITANLLPHWLNDIRNTVRRLGVYDPSVVKAITSMRPEDVGQWELHMCSPLDAVDPSHVYGSLNAQHFFASMPLMPGADVAIKQLMEDGHQVYLVTARYGKYAHQETIAWVKECLPFLDAEKQLIFAYDKHLLSADVLIDDKPATLISYKSTHPNAEVMGIKYAYNQHLSKRAGINLFPYGPIAWGMICGYLQAKDEVNKHK